MSKLFFALEAYGAFFEVVIDFNCKIWVKILGNLKIKAEQPFRLSLDVTFLGEVKSGQTHDLLSIWFSTSDFGDKTRY